MSFLAEPRQRKVIRVAMVYLVVAWVGIQAASIALPAFDAPPWTLRVLMAPPAGAPIRSGCGRERLRVGQRLLKREVSLSMRMDAISRADAGRPGSSLKMRA